MNAEDIRTIEDLIAFLGKEKTEKLFLEYIAEVIGKDNQNTEADFVC